MATEPRRKAERFSVPEDGNEIYHKLEERAIAESNDLNRMVSQCRRCQRGDFLPTVGSGHPLADILMVKYGPRYLEVSEGVAFFGRSGAAILKSVERLAVDPLLLYGTNAVKCPGVESAEGEQNCPGFLLEEIQITQPKMLVVMGEKALEVLNRHRLVTMAEISWRPGEIQVFTPFCRVLVTPDIDDSLDDGDAKRAFWNAFRALGDWYRDEPPY
ncbi:MAG TPA: uracil-DNA glycosylase family protein [Thermoleophilia bacterium]|nr:uracil-DNA glycosylase family protein [Thermoleophilia bacterium]